MLSYPAHICYRSKGAVADRLHICLATATFAQMYAILVPPIQYPSCGPVWYHCGAGLAVLQRCAADSNLQQGEHLRVFQAQLCTEGGRSSLPGEHLSHSPSLHPSHLQKSLPPWSGPIKHSYAQRQAAARSQMSTSVALPQSIIIDLPHKTTYLPHIPPTFRCHCLPDVK